MEAIKDLVTCPVCLEIYTEPRMLKCMHTLCLPCVQVHYLLKTTYMYFNVQCICSYRFIVVFQQMCGGKSGEVTCPECRVTCSVKDMRQNFHVASLIDVYKSSAPRPVSSRARIRSNQGEYGTLQSGMLYMYGIITTMYRVRIRLGCVHIHQAARSARKATSRRSVSTATS